MDYDQLHASLKLLGWHKEKYSNGPFIWKFKNHEYGIRIYSNMHTNINDVSYIATFYDNYNYDSSFTASFKTYDEVLPYITDEIEWEKQ